MSLLHAKAVMEMELPDPASPNFKIVMSAKQAAMQSIFTTTARVRDGLLRPAQDDGFDRVRAAIAAAENDDLDEDDSVLFS